MRSTVPFGTVPYCPEPNSSLGGSVSYMLRHWEKLTLLLRQPGAPLDNNICERALKKAVLHRKNALSYKAKNGAHVGDVFMSLIHTCQLCEANPFDYLSELQRHNRSSPLPLVPPRKPWPPKISSCTLTARTRRSVRFFFR